MKEEKVERECTGGRERVGVRVEEAEVGEELRVAVGEEALVAGRHEVPELVASHVRGPAVRPQHVRVQRRPASITRTRCIAIARAT